MKDLVARLILLVIDGILFMAIVTVTLLIGWLSEIVFHMSTIDSYIFATFVMGLILYKDIVLGMGYFKKENK